MKKVHLDYELRSRCDLKSCGSHRYGIDPSTEVLMAAVSDSAPDAPIRLWISPAFIFADHYGENEEAEALLASADVLVSHTTFEQAVTWGVMQRGGLCPFKKEPPLSIWRDTAAVARKAALPWSLDKLGEALQLETKKDARGKALIKFFCEPDKKTGLFREPKDHPEKWELFCSYCKTDVEAEKQADRKLAPFQLTGFMLESFLFDIRLNQRGIPVNREALTNAQRIIESVESRVTKEFIAITGLNPTQRDAVVEWLDKNCKLVMPNMQAETVAYFVERETGTAKRVLELYSKLSYAAIKKVQTMLDWMCPDGRIRGSLLWYGAGTGRWSSKGVQFQNAKRPTLEMAPMTKMAYLSICRGATAEEIDLIYGEPFEVLASSIRHFVHLVGEQMLDGDFNAVEGRVGCWSAKEETILQLWRDGKDLYRRAVAFVYGVSEDSIPKKDPRRQFGKVLELAGIFGLGTDGFMLTCENWGIPCDRVLADRGIHGYLRPTHPKVVRRWWHLGDCMLRAIAAPGVEQGPVVVRTLAGRKYMLLKLPSGRSLAYPDIEMNVRKPTEEEQAEMKKGKKYPDSRFQEVTFWGQKPMSQVWDRIRIWGSLLFQNETQAIAADFIAHGAIQAERAGMEPFLLVHDQALALKKNFTEAQYEAALSILPAWARGMPLRTEVHSCDFYAKD